MGTGALMRAEVIYIAYRAPLEMRIVKPYLDGHEDALGAARGHCPAHFGSRTLGAAAQHAWDQRRKVSVLSLDKPTQGII